MRLVDSAFEVVDDDIIENTTEEMVHPVLGGDEFLSFLRQYKFSEGVVTEGAGAGKQMCRFLDSCFVISNRNAITVVDLDPLARFILEPDPSLVCHVCWNSALQLSPEAQIIHPLGGVLRVQALDRRVSLAEFSFDLLPWNLAAPTRIRRRHLRQV